MLTIEDKLILKRKVYLQNGQQTIKTYRLLRYRYKSQCIQIYDVFDSQLGQQLTLKIMIKNDQLSKQKSINEIKNQQLFVGLPNFISLYDIYEDNEKIYLVMEKWGGTLADLANERITLTEYQVQMIFSQLVDIAVELRKVNIAHNLITLESLYIDIRHKHKIKLGDFKKSFNVASYFEDFLPERKQLSSNSLEKLEKKPTPFNVKLASKQQEKPTPYSSPEQRSLTQDYTKYLANLYENDIWNIGIIVFRLLMGRFPFEDEQTDNIKYAFEVFVNKKQHELENSQQRSFTFFEKQNPYSQPISLQFKQLIKAILRPAHKRIKLKDLLNHPLKLQYYHNLTDLNFQHHLPPLMYSNLPLYTPLKPIKSFLFQNYLLTKQIQFLEEEQHRINSNPRILQSNCSNFFQTQSHKRKTSDLPENMSKSKKKNSNEIQDNQEHLENVKFLSPKANFSLFSIFNDKDKIYPSERQKQKQKCRAKQKYFYTWNINFGQKPELSSQVSISRPIRESQLQLMNSQHNKRSDVDQDHHIFIGQKTSVYNLGKTSQHFAGFDIEHQTESKDNNSEQNQKENNLTNKQINLHKRLPSTSSHKRQLLRSFHNFDNNDSNVVKSIISNPQFNIRNINSKKNLASSNVYSNKKHTLDKAEQNYQTSSIPSNHTNLYGGSLSNSRLIQSKQPSLNSNSSSNKIALRKYQGRSDEICQLEENTESVKYCLQGPNKQEELKLKQMFIQGRETQLLILRNQVAQLPLLVEQPEFVLQYKYKKDCNSLGYVMNNGVGVIFDNGKQVIGHNQNDFIILKQDLRLQDSPQCLIKKGSKSSFDPKCLNSTQIQIYHEYLKLFGKRIVISNFSIWIHKYWRMGRVFLFLFSNGSWQVTLQGKKTSKFFIIDQNQLIWTKSNVNPEVLNEVRNIVKRKRQEIMEEEYFFK